jgi:hypothetical protein
MKRLAVALAVNTVSPPQDVNGVHLCAHVI